MPEPATESSKAERSGEVEYSFSRAGNRISFHAIFFVPAKPSSIIDAIYSFDHLRRFMTVARVELLDQAEGWQDVRYTYEKLMLKIQAVFRRRVEQPGRKIAFAMKGIAPLLSSFSGYYVIEPAEGGGRVEYFHEMTVPYVIAGLVHYEGTKEAKRYIAGLRDYIGAVCK